MAADVDLANVLSLCSGIGGLDLGIKAAIRGSRTICYVEIEAFACAVLASQMEAGNLDPAPIWPDLHTFDGRKWRGVVDILAAGYPCQPFSYAGRRKGTDDPRHLWPQVRRTVEECSPSAVFLENVPGHMSLGLLEVRRDLLRLGYQVEAGLFSAEEVGAPHKRTRLFILAMAHTGRPRLAQWLDQRGDSYQECTALERGRNEVMADAMSEGHEKWSQASNKLANPNSDGCEVVGQSPTQRCVSSRRDADECSEGIWPPTPGDTDRWANYLDAGGPEPTVRGSYTRTADRVDELAALGNAVVPAQAAFAFRYLAQAILEG